MFKRQTTRKRRTQNYRAYISIYNVLSRQPVANTDFVSVQRAAFFVFKFALRQRRDMKKTEISIAITRVVFALIIFVFAIVSYRGLSYGWFSRNQSAGAGGMSVKADGGGAMNAVACHAFLYGDNGIICRDASIAQAYEMLKYDAILTDKNLNTPLIFRVVATGVSADGSITVTVPRIKIDNEPVFSEVAAVKVAFGLKIDGNIEKDIFTPDGANNDNAEIFCGVRDLIKSEEATAGGNVAYGTFGENDKISLTITGYQAYMCAVNNGVCDYDSADKNALVFYITFDYDTALINAFLQDAEEKNDIKFFNDIGTISFE